MTMNFLNQRKRIVLIIVCVFTVVASYIAYMNMHVSYITINDEFGQPIYMSGPMVSYELNGNFMQMVDVPEGIEHQIQTFVPDNTVEYFIAPAQPNSSFLRSLTDREMVQDFNLVVTDGQVEHSIQMVEVSDDVKHLITTFTPNSDVEYFIEVPQLGAQLGAQLGEPTIQDLKSLENTTE